jgi:hypothetical protein
VQRNKHFIQYTRIKKGFCNTCTKLKNTEVQTAAMIKSVTDSVNKILLIMLQWMTERQQFVTIQEDGQEQQMLMQLLLSYQIHLGQCFKDKISCY